MERELCKRPLASGSGYMNRANAQDVVGMISVRLAKGTALRTALLIASAIASLLLFGCWCNSYRSDIALPVTYRNNLWQIRISRGWMYLENSPQICFERETEQLRETIIRTIARQLDGELFHRATVLVESGLRAADLREIQLLDAEEEVLHKKLEDLDAYANCSIDRRHYPAYSLDWADHPHLTYYVFDKGADGKTIYWDNRPPSPFPRSVAVSKRVALAVLVPFAAFPLAHATRRQLVLRSRRLRGLCLICGYDLRAGGFQCPECGSLIPRKNQTKG
jgi:hypothetical protein